MHPTRGSFGTILLGQRCRPLWRAPISLIAALAVLVALFHSHCAVAESSIPIQVSAVGSVLKALPAELPDDQLPGHSGHCSHCLCHAAFQSGFDSISIQFRATAFSVRGDRCALPAPGFQLFKPPRL
jgi:hypothetical protein